MGTNDFDDYMAAAAFAEAGEFDTAREMLGSGGKESPRHAENRKPWGKTVVFGTISLSAYVVLFTHQDLVTGIFTMGGWHALFPVGTAFLFSFVHGAFASSLLSSLNLEAKK